jgi:hypothetical protein
MRVKKGIIGRIEDHIERADAGLEPHYVLSGRRQDT